jgi:hypothetical protein
MKKSAPWLLLLLAVVTVACTFILVRRYRQRHDPVAMDEIDQIAELELRSGDQNSKPFIATVRDHRIQLQKQLRDGTLTPDDIGKMWVEKFLDPNLPRNRLVIESPADHRARIEELNRKLDSAGNN